VAIESTDQPVKTETDIARGRAISALLSASRSAAMVCVGVLGRNGAAGRHVGSTAAELVSRAQCPVAVVRRAVSADAAHTKWIVAEFDSDPACTSVIEAAVDEARRRDAPLRVLTSWRPLFTDIHDTRAATDGKRMATANLDRYLERWRRLHPQITIQAVAVSCGVLGYVARNIKSTQLVVVGAHRRDGLTELVGHAANAALHDTNCSLLVLGRQRPL
jgi:nucleotide-binding universal stress UspA family protein